MLILLSLFAIAVGLGSIACWITLVVKMFKHESTLWGILGIIPPVALIWGWVRGVKGNARQFSLIWTILIVVNFFLTFLIARFVPAAPQ